MKKIYLLNDNTYENVENLEVFKIEYKKIDFDFSVYSALIFTSKNAIKALEVNKQTSWKNIDSYAISSKTASHLKNKNAKIKYIGSSKTGDDFASELINQLKNKKSLYIRAEKTVSNLTSILKENNINIDELVAYKTICNKVTTQLDKNSVFIFSSPSSVKCFFKNYSWHESFKAVVIGKTTAKYMPKDIEYITSSQISIDECINQALKL